MSNQNGYLGRSPGDSAVIIASQTFEPTGIQTNFTFASGYTVGYLDVYFNGARLIYANDYTATNGSTVGLTTYANNGDVIECVAYKAFNVGDVTGAKNNFTVGSAITMTGDTGTISATSFTGDGSALTGIASTDNIITGTAVTITNTTNSTSTTTGALIVSGGVGVALSMTVGGSLSVGGTITYEDVTNQDVIGLATFRSGVQFGVAGVGGTITGVGNATIVGILTVGGNSTFTGDINAGGNIDLPDSNAIKLGDSDDLWLWHDASNHSIIRNATGDLRLQSDSITLKNYEGTHNYLTGTENGAVDIYYNNSQKFETHNTGVKVTGVSTVTGNSFVGSAVSMYASSGIVSATAFYGDGANLTGIPAGFTELDAMLFN